MRNTTFNINSNHLTEDQSNISKILKFITNLRFVDIQAACIIRGMDFQDLAESDFGDLETYLLRNFDNDQDRALLEDYDIWVDEKLAKKYDKDHPLRQFKKFSIWDEEGEINVNTKKLKRAGVPKKKPKKVNRNTTFNVICGTKKEYTYSLCESLHKKFKDKYDNKVIVKRFNAQLIIKVNSKFGEANEKSVRIWMKRALDALSTIKG